MKLLGILRASALCLLVSAFQGPRGIFCSNLEWDPSNESFTVEVSEDHEDSTVESSSELSSPAPKSNLVFQSSEWNDSHLASAVLFLKQFCKEVISKKFNEKLSEAEYDDVSRACVYLSFKLESVTNHFAPAYGPGTVTERKDIPKNFYKDVLKPEKFDVYAIWLAENIQNITESYKKMLEESVKLTATELKTETSMGPLKYGFVYNGYWWGEIVYWLPPDVYTDTGFLEALNELKISLVKIPRIPVETSTVDYQINEDDVEEPFSADVSDISGNLDGSPVEPQVVEDAIEESSKVNETDIAENKGTTVEPQPSAPSSQSGLVFKSSKWDDSHLASAFLFIEEFCKDVKAEKFNEKLSDANMKGLSKKCANLSAYVGSFIHRFKPTYGPGTVDKRKEIPMDFYKDVLKAEDFKLYAKWIVKNIPAVLESLGLMSMEYLCMSEKQRETATSMGPLRYGFVYTGKPWGELTHGVNRGLFKDPDILQSFKDLKSSLDKILKSFPKDSTVESQTA
ncbi:secreted antigen 1 [Babesia divergens]|uniref:Secreted antigen 1 n=1 Tax=Babesia divergens TaxID=32595 RepID=A0AAD9LEL6_BABDI|nr:secreted antigen 1 [Babesia divergens]